MDIKEIIKWALHRWWWFVISLAVCTTIGVVRFYHTAPVFSVEASLMLRQTEEKSNQKELLNMMGMSGNKISGDEVKVLTSRELMGCVVDSLGLCTSYSKKGERFWQIQYPSSDLLVYMTDPVYIPIDMKMKVKGNQVKLFIKYDRKSQRLKLTLDDLNKPIPTIAGEMNIKRNVVDDNAAYKVLIFPRVVAIEVQLRQIKVARLSKESNVITISTSTTCPVLAINTINMLLDLYNQSEGTDKNQVAFQTAQFLSTRLSVISSELTRIEAQLEEYKRTRQIADLDEVANTYQQTGLVYQQQVAELESELDVLNFMGEQLANPANRYTMIPGNMGISDNTLAMLIQDYNDRIAHRNLMLQTATLENPVVQQETELIDQKRQSIKEGIVQARQSISMRKEFVLKQQQQYDSRLAAVPETERCYMELCRDKETKEEQYLYLIEKQEENAMLLASDAVPAKIVDHAQLNPFPVAPKIRLTLVKVFCIGVLLPFLVFFFGYFRKELL